MSSRGGGNGVEEGPSCWSVWMVPRGGGLLGKSPEMHESHIRREPPQDPASSGAPVSLPWASREPLLAPFLLTGSGRVMVENRERMSSGLLEAKLLEEERC